jgi:ubiquinone/menaquinone biosynthesis C-methylase UbiE
MPKLEGVEPVLKQGAKVADVGCELGASTILMARAYPNSAIVGFDFHAQSVELARQRAAEAGVGDRVRFEVAKAKEFPGTR